MTDSSASAARVAELLARRGSFAHASEFAAAALDALGDPDELDPAAVDLLVAHARRTPGEESCEVEEDDHGALWSAAAARGGALWLELRLGWLRGALRAGGGTGRAERRRSGGEDDGVRELYGELLDEHRGDAGALARIRAVGRLIDEAVERGDLPRALVRRAPR